VNSLNIENALPDDLAECEAILRALPDWFGIEEAIEHYAADMRRMTTLVARRDGRLLGFLSLNRHNDSTVEIHVMAVDQEHHRQGVGRALVDAAERWSRERNYRLIEVKTLGPTHPSEHYRRTRAFYTAQGFLSLEELDGLWPGNPCLIMVKVLDTPGALEGHFG
jgi:GNAT superfamily N-acetyltransferase